MSEDCLICNAQLALSKNHIKNVFSDLNVLINNETLLEALQEILGKTLHQETIHSKALCRKCYKTCADYTEYKTKMDIIKMDLSQEFNTTLHTSRSIKVHIKEEKTMGTIVVPASKLVPVPADFQLNLSHLTGLGQAVSKANIISKTKVPSINLKVTIGSSVLTQSVNTSTVKIAMPESTDVLSTVKIAIPETTDALSAVKLAIPENDSLLSAVKIAMPETSSVLSTVKITAPETSSSDIAKQWDNIVPREIFSTNDDASQNDDDDNSDGMANDDGNGDEEEQHMEIDEECSLTVLPDTPEGQDPFSVIKTEEGATSEYAEYITISEGGTEDGNYVFEKFKIFNSQNGDDEHTIVVDGDNASVLEMMTGQKVIYQNGGLSLVMADDDAIEDGGNDDDGQDSNEESQIELQVSGDEETANAIIAAAQEKGGAFIKVESGAMYRVRSVGRARDSGADVDALVAAHGDRFRCRLCRPRQNNESEKVLDASAMMQHLKTEHDAKVYLCQFCGRGMRKRSDYTAHLTEHSRQPGSPRPAAKRLHECALCNKTYSSRTLLHEHMNAHTGTRPYRCDVCDKTFASKYTLQAHLKTHQDRPRPYKCEQCEKSFLSIQNLKQHEKTHSGIKDFVCKFCNKAFGTQHNLEIHGVVHTGARPYPCTVCDKAFARRAELVDHRRTHTGERPFECEVCGARFAQRSNLHSHRRATHLHDKRHQCPECPKRFKRRRLLEYHIKASHTGERPLKCEVCQATFVYPEHYKKHVKIHTGLRPYFCEICGKSFSSRDNRNTHRFTHSEKKPYECLTCGQSYMRKRLLIAHMNSSGHLAESIVVNQPRVTRVHKNETGATTLVELDNPPEILDSQEKIEAIFRTSGKLESIDKAPMVNKILSDDGEKIFVDCGNLEQATEANLNLETVDASQAQELTAQFGTDANGAVLRLIQVKLPNGSEGWVALN